MTDHPVLVETSVGVLGGIVTTPDGPPVGAAVVLQGSFGTRAGTNQLWRRVAQGLGDLGVVTLRVDYPSMGESHLAQPDAGYTGLHEIVRWFRGRTGDLDEIVISLCAGMLPAVEVAREHERIASVAVIVPPLLPTDAGTPRRRASLARRVAYRVRRAPGRMRLRVRYGSSRQRPMFDAASFARAPEMVAELAHRGPLWLLTGEHDACTPVLRQVASELAEIESCQLDVVPDLVLRAYPTPEAQREILDRTLAWAVRSFQGAKVSS